MPFTEEEKIIIKHYRQTYNWGSRKILTELGDNKSWTRVGIEYLIKKSIQQAAMKESKAVDVPALHGQKRTML